MTKAIFQIDDVTYSSPNYAFSMYLKQNHLTKTDLVKNDQLTRQDIKVLTNNSNLNKQLIVKLSQLTGSSINFWYKQNKIYRAGVKLLKAQEILDKQNH